MKNNRVLEMAPIIGIFIILSLSIGQCYGALQSGYYNKKCNITTTTTTGFWPFNSKSQTTTTEVNVEATIKDVVKLAFGKDRTLVAALLRMQFHDCFVKEGRVNYVVETGRLDGKESKLTNVNLPPPTISVANSISAFRQKGLDIADMVYLLEFDMHACVRVGGHTVGTAHCSLFQDRVYNFNGSGKPDPTMNSTLVNSLKSKCPSKSSFNNIVPLDQSNEDSSLVVDKSFYNQLVMKRGILKIDQDLANDEKTKDVVKQLAFGNNDLFAQKFGQAMVKLGRVEVITDKSKDVLSLVLAMVTMGLFLLSLSGQCYGGVVLQPANSYYNKKCTITTPGFWPLFKSQTTQVNVEATVKTVVKAAFSKDPTIVAALLRLQFHDCFVKKEEGGHTVGVAHCTIFQDRLYNFNGTKKADPTMDSLLVKSLKSKCPQKPNPANTVFLDQTPGSSMVVDKAFFNQLVKKRGVLKIDQDLAIDKQTKNVVTQLANGNAYNFAQKFGQAMVKLGRVEVITDKTKGEIRRSCRVTN
ncbi:hypothetical protein F8388_023780 [Cannabis sativa]|uniref:peroxidase n=1 Tax=Cannabis sativa TaxID=3483 RepID=A0A7J6G9X5_CANSA|nr:hypothetical protein F8388_023780 [Cannabis sativa]